MRDYDIRVLLRKTQLRKFILDSDSRIVEEMQLPASYARIDMAVINGHFHGFEIKSAVDTLKRLPGQIEAYKKVFDYINVVTEEKHYKKIVKEIPEWIGVYICKGIDENVTVEKLRAAKKNKNRDAFYIAKLLWREELILTLQDLKIPFRKKDRNWILCETLSNSIEIDKLSYIVREKLKARPLSWKGNSIVIDADV